MLEDASRRGESPIKIASKVADFTVEVLKRVGVVFTREDILEEEKDLQDTHCARLALRRARGRKRSVETPEVARQRAATAAVPLFGERDWDCWAVFEVEETEILTSSILADGCEDNYRAKVSSVFMENYEVAGGYEFGLKVDVCLIHAGSRNVA
ncbi:hypothetical protein WN55_00872 [Dufourea novaeangliae]|uniref:Uncharacterized protein n=1 Tax=Dufourea novaeangliae TaxID=178035 RepID=A0A154PD60_DUFNO|nr:hypothetical protein WN55_00872 [Dufourea novaeangliae]